MTPIAHSPIPEYIHEAIAVVRALEKENRRTNDAKKMLNQARLKVAFWACHQEGVYASWDNLCYVLGAHAEAIRPTYERMFGPAKPK